MTEPVSEIDLGPQVKSDTAFVARVRRHQSWWRAERLGVPWGTGPTPNSDRELGNMLRSSDAGTGANFLTPEIHDLALARIAEGHGVEPFRCTHNLLSSQPMCFNLFGPLVADHHLALELLGPLLPVPAVTITNVTVEYSPSPAAEYLGDLTAFDAFIEFINENGDAGFIGIETKLSEPFSQKVYDTPRYRELTELEDSPWSGSPPELADRRWNQLWRNQLLVEATRRHPAQPHGRRGWLAVVHHPDDPSIGGTIDGYRTFLAHNTSMLEWPLDQMIETFRTAAKTEEVNQWLTDFEDRYVQLELSTGGVSESSNTAIPGTGDTVAQSPVPAVGADAQPSPPGGGDCPHGSHRSYCPDCLDGPPTNPDVSSVDSGKVLGYACPYCSVVATYPHNLRKHLTGSPAYGGHSIDHDEADRLSYAARRTRKTAE